jgi:ArsR family transcriptional regulator, arsenate/arsenite/antimonite-responsive transcriptional repressor
MTVELDRTFAPSEQTEEMQVRVFKALADPVRLQILRYLHQVDRGVTCGEIDAVINITKSAGSYHFKVLRDAGLTITEKKSREKYVAINRHTVDYYVTGFVDLLGG